MRQTFKLACMSGLFLLLWCGSATAQKRTWKPAGNEVILTMDGEPVKLWEVYVGNKEGSLILIQLGRRYLRMDTKAREVVELDPKALRNNGKEIEETAAAEQKKVPSGEWVIRDIGRARLVRVKLQAEGRVLEVQLGRRADFRSLY